MSTILLVEDEQDMREMIALKLRREGFTVIEAEDGLTAEQLACQERPDLIILDLMLPGRNGLSICRNLRRDPRGSEIPILMLTARASLDDKINGLETGADDYMTKPFSPRELVLRVRNLLRRAAGGSADAVMEFGQLRIDRSKLTVYVGDEAVELTSTEYKLLLALTELPNVTRERDELLRKIWGYSEQAQTRTLDTHIKRLRAKLGMEAVRVETVRSVGYQFNDAKEI
jgi:two-component system phosphate regulon response regulator PhoB